jgi:hypothetical protein
MNFADYYYKLKGINPDAKKAYVSLFNSINTRDRGSKVIEDLITRFGYYGPKPTNDPILLAKQAGHREVIDYILTMAARVSKDTLSEIEKLINKGGNTDDY